MRLGRAEVFADDPSCFEIEIEISCKPFNTGSYGSDCTKDLARANRAWSSTKLAARQAAPPCLRAVYCTAHPPLRPTPQHGRGRGPRPATQLGRSPPPPVVGPVAQGFRPANPKLALLPRRSSNGAGTLAPSSTHRPPRGSSWYTMLIHGAPALHAGGRERT